jgi:hypothetical protein
LLEDAETILVPPVREMFLTKQGWRPYKPKPKSGNYAGAEETMSDKIFDVILYLIIGVAAIAIPVALVTQIARLFGWS